MANMMTLQRFLWLLTSILLTTAEFTRIPETQSVGVGLDAEFQCQHSTALLIGWLVDGISVNQINNSGMYLNQSNFRDGDGSLVRTLTILARPEYNGTIVECVATFLTAPAQRSPAVILIIEDTCGSLTITTTFIETPRPGIVADGSDARFRCHHRRTNRITFLVDGLSLNDSLVENASIVALPDRNGRSLFILMFEATQVLDGSTIVCIAVFRNGCPNQETLPALLLIQGPLSAVTGFRRLPSNQVLFSWTPPPTLDLTDVDPDIIYGIEVYNITCGSHDLLSHNYNLATSFYGDALLDPDYVYKVVIIPRSNVHGAKNGTRLVEYERFMKVNVSSVVVVANSSGVVVEFSLLSVTDTVNAYATWHSLILRPLDDPEASTALEIDEDGVMTVLPRRQLWFITALAYGCQEHRVSKTTVISTHDVQDVSTTSLAGGIRVTGHFINNSGAVGLLIIVYSLTREAEIQYTFSQRPKEQQETEKILTGLSDGDYQTSVFVVDKSGLPFEQVASLPSNVSISDSEVSETVDIVVEQPITYEVHPTLTGICITCTFLDSSTTDCVAVVHQRISQLSSSGLMNIKSRRKFNRSGDTAYGCIEGFNIEEHQVGVVGGRRIPQSKALGNIITTVIVSVVVVTVVVAVFFLVIVPLIIVCAYRYICTHKNIRKKPRYPVSETSPYEDVVLQENSLINIGHATNYTSTASLEHINATIRQSGSQEDACTSVTTPLLGTDSIDAVNNAHNAQDNEHLSLWHANSQDPPVSEKNSANSTLSNHGDDDRNEQPPQVAGENPEYSTDEQMQGQGKPSSQPVSEDHDRKSQKLIANPQLKLQSVTGAPDLSPAVSSNVATDKLNGASQDVSNLPHQVEDSKIPSNIKYVPSNSKRMDTPATTPEDAPNTEELSTITASPELNAATIMTSEESQTVQAEVDDQKFPPPTINSDCSFAEVPSRPSKGATETQEQPSVQHTSRPKKPQRSIDQGQPTAALARHNSIDHSPPPYQSQQHEPSAFQEHKEEENISVNVDSSYQAPEDEDSCNKLL